MIRTMNEMSFDRMRTLAIRLAQEAAQLSQRRNDELHTALKADRSVVTNVDVAIQEHTVSAILRQFPDHGIVAEEAQRYSNQPVDPAQTRYTWVIDPLDGTRNYVAGLPCFSTSIAVLEHGIPVIGVILEHNLGHVFSAIRNEGATLNGKPIKSQPPPAGGDWLIGIPSSKDRLAVRVVRSWAAKKGYICRNLGSTAVHFGLVASSGLTAVFAKRAKIWDLAAGVLIAAEAGATVSSPTGSPVLPFDLRADSGRDVPCLAAPRLVHDTLLSSIQEADERAE